MAEPPATGTTEETIDAPAGTTSASRTDMRLRLGAGIRVFPRSLDQWQIGTEHPRRVIVDGPAEQLDALLRTWTTTAGRTDRSAAVESAAGTDTVLTPAADEVARRLIDLGMLARAPDRTAALATAAERSALAHRYGADQTELMATRRGDATIEVRGSGAVASQLAALLVAAGVGHVHQTPDRPLRTEDVLPPLPPSSSAGDDRQRLAERLSGISERTRVFPIPSHQPTSLVILAGDGPPEPTDAKPLVDSSTPHLAAWAGAAGAVVGPMVLPGRSSCLWCAELVRADADPDWPLVRRAIREQPVPAPVVHAVAAAVLAAAQALELVEGVQPPGSIDGTFEWDARTPLRRRSWQRHPRCGCPH